MTASPWTFYRGAAAVMAADLASRPNTGLTVQLCGDAHVLNFGLWATPERQLSFDLRDFDETLPGPFEWDVARLVASLVVLAGTTRSTPAAPRGPWPAACGRIGTRMADYAGAGKLDIWYDLIDGGPDSITVLPPPTRSWRGRRRQAGRRRTSRGAVRKLTDDVDGHLRITEDPPRRVHLDQDELRTRR